MGPRIETGRLVLRLPVLEDAPFIARYAGDYDVAKMTGSIPHPYPRPAAEMWVLVNLASWKPEGRQSLTVEADGAVIGGGGVFRRTPDADWEIGYWIGKPWWGRGYATEVGRALVDFARDGMGLTCLTAGHYHDNPASGRVLEKLGFRYTGESEDMFCMARMAKTRSLDMVLEMADGDLTDGARCQVAADAL